MDRNKKLPHTPAERAYAMANCHTDSYASQKKEDLSIANQALLREVLQLRLEKDTLLNEQKKAEREMSHYLEIIEIQKAYLKNIMQYIVVSTSDCRTTVTQKNKEWERGTTEDHSAMRMF
jgi:hypothetical protein